MSSNSQNNPDNPEIDLSQISRKVSQAYQGFLAWIFRGFLFVKKNVIILAILFIIGAGIGFYLDRKTTVYNHEIIVTPNLGSTEYVYSKISLIKAKIRERDLNFLKAIGIQEPTMISDIEIEPITDIYGFINAKEQNFEMIKLMAEDGDINKIIVDETTSKNYSNYRISVTTKGIVSKKEIIEPILKYLNESSFFAELQKSLIESIHLKIQANEKMISQIDSLLANFSSATGNTKNDKLVYFNNENTQLNDILKTKNELIQEQANKKIELITNGSIVKENSEVLNIKNHASINGKLKFILPILFIGMFLCFGLIRAFYRSQMAKLEK